MGSLRMPDRLFRQISFTDGKAGNATDKGKS